MGTRVALESTLYSQNSFLTLTYDPQNIPKNHFLDYDAPVLFMKRLRRQNPQADIRSYGCAEYGENFFRPHFHICILNFDFSDKKFLKNSNANLGKNHRENALYTSEELQDLWPFGHSTIGSLTLESASYVARYCTKKYTGKNADSHYEVVDQSTGEILTRPPERSVCVSTRRGIGFPWYEKYGKFVRDNDFVVVEGKKIPPPKYFDKLTEAIDPDRFEEIKLKRRLAGQRATDALNRESHLASEKAGHYIKHRLFTMEECQELTFLQLKRGIENV